MTNWGYALSIIIIQGVLLSNLKKHVNRRNAIWSTVAICGFVGFLLVANEDQAKISMGESAKNSLLAAWLAFSVICFLIALQLYDSNNVITDIARTWNKNTYHLLLVSLIVLLVISVTGSKVVL